MLQKNAPEKCSRKMVPTLTPGGAALRLQRHVLDGDHTAVRGERPNVLRRNLARYSTGSREADAGRPGQPELWWAPKKQAVQLRRQVKMAPRR